MCGVAGIFHLNGRPIHGPAIRDMIQAQAHRGPDDWGYVLFSLRSGDRADESYWVEGRPGYDRSRMDEEMSTGAPFNFALGHTRLSIIDLSEAGHQPMSNRVSGIWVVFNGEIYNHQELRAELKEKGHVFFSRTDTEVILHLYEEHGLDFVHRLNGMFALALWDQRHERLMLVRDRYGIKPLYYTVVDETLVFASEIKALLRYPGLRVRINEPALLDYFTFQNTYGSATLFDGIELLQPGQMMVLETGRRRLESYWDFEFVEGKDRGEAYYRSALREVLEAAVQRQLMADVPVGSYLSGGLDSGSIAGLAARRIPRLMTFTGGFDTATATSVESLFDERDKSELMSSYLGTEHYQMVIHAGDLEWALPKVIRHIEDLRLGMCYPGYFIARLAGKFVKVALAGTGGDEILAGYPWRYKLVAEETDPIRHEEAYFAYWCRLVPEHRWGGFFSEELLRRTSGHSARTSFHTVMEGVRADHPVKKAMGFEARTFLPGLLLLEDKLSMAHGLEARVPLLDDDLVALAATIPVKHLINYAWTPKASGDENLAGKYVLRRAMEDVLPPEIIYNRKQGFSAPEQTWYRLQLNQYLRDIILGPRALERHYFQEAALERILDEHFAGRVNHRLLIWSLLSFEWWNRIFVDGEDL